MRWRWPAHHAAVHDGRLAITGLAPDALVFTFHREHCLPSDDCDCAPSSEVRSPRPRRDWFEPLVATGSQVDA